MSETTWASEMLQERVAPRGKVGERIRSASRVLGWKFSRTRTVWYADERASIKPKELRRIEEVTGVEYGRRERREVEAIISRADTLLMGSDPDFHSPFVAAVRAFFGALDRAGTQGRGD